MWSIGNPIRTGLIWIGVPLVGLMLAVGLSWLGDWLVRPRYPDTSDFSSTTETLIVLPGALAGALFIVSLFVAPAYLAKAWRAWRQMRRFREPESAGILAGWTVDRSAWRRFQADLGAARGQDDRCGLSKMALSLDDLDPPSTGIDLCIGPEGIAVGGRYLSLRGSGPSNLSEVTQADFGPTPSLSGTEYLAFVSIYQGHSRALGAYEIEEIALLLPVPPVARAAMQRVLDHFTPEAISALQARDRQAARAGCLLNLTLLTASLAMIAISALFDVPHVGWYGLILLGAWAAWLTYYLIQAVIALVSDFGPMVGMMRRMPR